MPGPGLDLIGDEELAEGADVLRSGHSGRYGPAGPSFPARVRTFEDAVSDAAGVPCALAVDSGTGSLDLPLTGLGIGGMPPATDALLARSMSFAIGGTDPSLAPLGRRLRDGGGVAVAQAQRFREVAEERLASGDS